MRALLAGAAIATAGVISGCGASRTVSQALDPVARAADVTSKVPGYRVAGVVSVSTPAGAVKTTMAGVIDRSKRTGHMTATESIAGHSFTIDERFAGLRFFMDAAGLPGASRLTHGKRWLMMDMSQAFGSMGMGSLSASSSDPSQFVDYLRAVSAKTRTVGAATVRGVATTRYHAVIDLRKYPRIVGHAQQATARRAISTMEQVLGGHTMAMDVWIDASKLVRQISFSLPECVNGQKLAMSMTMDLYDYGPQPATQMPSASQAFDLTPLISASMKNVKFGCSAGSA